jgi:hypothetical protein
MEEGEDSGLLDLDLTFWREESMFESVSSAIVAVQSRTADTTSGYAVELKVSDSLASTQDFIVVRRVVAWCVRLSRSSVRLGFEDRVEKERKRDGREERVFQHWVRRVSERGWVLW